MLSSATVYRPRYPQSSDYYRCVEDHLDTFVQVYEERFERRYGFWRPYLEKVITRYLECGDLHHGFARAKCPDSHHEYLSGLLLQAPPFLSLLSSETGGGIRGMSLLPRAQEDTSPAFRLQPPEDPVRGFLTISSIRNPRF